MVKKTVNILTHYLKEFSDEKRKIFLTSSFQTQSIPLLHIVSIHFSKIPVLFIDNLLRLCFFFKWYMM